MRNSFAQFVLVSVLGSVLSISSPLFADVNGVVDGIPVPEHRNVIVQLFNWRFNDIKAIIPELKTLGYSHIHVSPPQKSNELVWQWWGRYQPIDYSKIEGPLGNESEFLQMNQVADANDLQIIVDVVANHTVDVNEQPNPPFIVLNNDGFVSQETFPQFGPNDFHKRCAVGGGSRDQACWLSFDLADLKTETSHVRNVIKEYLSKLDDLGVDGYRFDAALHIEPSFFSEVLSVVPGKLAFGEIIKEKPSHFQDWINIPEMDFYDFPLTKRMRDAFAIGGDLRSLKNPKADDQALEGPKAITFARNHDIDRGQISDRGTEGSTFGIGWDEGRRSLDRTDIHLAYAYLFGREDGLPYVFADMNTLPDAEQDDRYADPLIVAGIRFHNLCLADTGGVSQREEHWRIETTNTIGWQRGKDRFIVINKAAGWYEIRNLETTLQQGQYKEVRTGWPMHVQADGSIEKWDVPPRSAMMFVRVGD